MSNTTQAPHKKKASSSTRRKSGVSKEIIEKTTATKKKPARPRKKAAKKQILLTGAGGALAQQVVERLKDTYQVIAADFRDRYDLGPEVTCYKIDFNKRNFEDLFRKYNFSGVIHLGRMTSIDGSRMNRYNANVLGTQRLLELSKKYGVGQIVVMSTYHVYGANAYNPALIDETAPLKAAELTMDLIDSVELENLANIYLWKHPELNISILRPCNVIGPGVRNTFSRLLTQPLAPTLLGFSPIMQFIHIEDMADAIVLAYEKNRPGIYNVAGNDYIPYGQVLKECGVTAVPMLSVPPVIPKMITQALGVRSFPSYLLNYFKYSVIIDDSLFRDTFDFTPKRRLEDILTYYRRLKQGSVVSDNLI